MGSVMFSETTYGFEYGNASVTRLFSDEKRGSVVIGLMTGKEDLQIYVTKTGKVRIHDWDGREWKPQCPTEP